MSARAAVHWLGHRIELNRAAVIAGATMLGLLLAGLIVLYARDSAADDQRREEIAAVVRQNRAAIARIDALELPTPNNIKAAIARYLRRRALELARARRRSPGPGVRGGNDPTTDSPTGSPTSPGSSPSPAGGQGPPSSTPGGGRQGGGGSPPSSSPGPAGPPGQPGAPGPPGPPSSPPPPAPAPTLPDVGRLLDDLLPPPPRLP